MQAAPKPLTPDEIAARHTNADQLERLDAAATWI
jgi:hypothetical protein